MSAAEALKAAQRVLTNTAEELSKRAGETTIFVESENRSTGVSRGKMDNVQEGAGQTTSEKGRRLIFAHEITTMDPGKELQLLFVQGEDAPWCAAPLLWFACRRHGADSRCSGRSLAVATAQAEPMAVWTRCAMPCSS